MDFALGLMMTAIGLFQEAESPLGHVKTLDPMEGGAGDGVKGPQEAAQGVNPGERVSQAIAEAFQRFERLEARRAGEKDQLYDRMRQTAARFESQRRAGG